MRNSEREYILNDLIDDISQEAMYSSGKPIHKISYQRGSANSTFEALLEQFDITDSQENTLIEKMQAFQKIVKIYKAYQQFLQNQPLSLEIQGKQALYLTTLDEEIKWNLSQIEFYQQEIENEEQEREKKSKKKKRRSNKNNKKSSREVDLSVEIKNEIENALSVGDFFKVNKKFVSARKEYEKAATLDPKDNKIKEKLDSLSFLENNANNCYAEGEALRIAIKEKEVRDNVESEEENAKIESDVRKVMKLFKAALDINAEHYGALCGFAFYKLSIFKENACAEFYNEIEKDFKNAGAIEPDKPNAYVGLGALYQLSQHSNVFIKEQYMLAKEKDKNNEFFVEIYIALGDIEAESRNYTAAVIFYEKIIKAIKLKKFSKKTQSEIYFKYARILEALNRIEEAKESFKLAFEINPNHQAARRTFPRLNAFQKGEEERKNKNYEKAKRYYNIAHNFGGECLVAYQKRFIIDIALKEYKNAHKDIIQLNWGRFSSELAPILCQYARILLRDFTQEDIQQRIVASVSALDKVHRALPDYSEAYFELGVIYQLQIGRPIYDRSPEETKAIWKQYLQVSKQYYQKALEGNEKEKYAPFISAQFALMDGKYEDAISFYQLEIEKASFSLEFDDLFRARVHARLGYAYYKINRKEEAFEQYCQAIQLNTTCIYGTNDCNQFDGSFAARLYRYYVDVFIELKDYSSAETNYKQACKRDSAYKDDPIRETLNLLISSKVDTVADAVVQQSTLVRKESHGNSMHILFADATKEAAAISQVELKEEAEEKSSNLEFT